MQIDCARQQVRVGNEVSGRDDSEVQQLDDGAMAMAGFAFLAMEEHQQVP